MRGWLCLALILNSLGWMNERLAVAGTYSAWFGLNRESHCAWHLGPVIWVGWVGGSLCLALIRKWLESNGRVARCAWHLYWVIWLSRSLCLALTLGGLGWMYQSILVPGTYFYKKGALVPADCLMGSRAGGEIRGPRPRQPAHNSSQKSLQAQERALHR